MTTVADSPARAKRTRRVASAPAGPQLPVPSPAGFRAAVAAEVTRLAGAPAEVDPDTRAAVARMNDRMPEGWQPGGSPAPVPVAAPARPVERHGTCRLTLRIGSTEYTLRPFPPAEGSGLVSIWTLRKIQPDPLRAPVAYAIASDGVEAHCTCPDHEINGATCKHILSLTALRLLPASEGGGR